jgi:hypothetical protein
MEFKGITPKGVNMALNDALVYGGDESVPEWAQFRK